MRGFPGDSGSQSARGHNRMEAQGIDTLSLLRTIVSMISVEERQALSSAATLFKVLGHPVRVQILDMLTTQVMSVSMIASELSISQSSASKHLSLMKENGLISMERQNGQVLCSVKMRCAQFLLACAKNPDTAVVPSITPVPFRPSCE